MSYTAEITIYPSDDLRERLDRAAEKAGLTTSSFILSLLAKKFPARSSVNQELKDKGIEATKAKFERDGCEVLATNWEASNGVTFDLVIDEGGETAFAVVDIREGEMPAEQLDYDNAEMETAAGEWMLSHDAGNDKRFRFDSVCIGVIAGNRATLRHHRNFNEPWRG